MITILKDIPKGSTTSNPMWLRAKTDNYQSLVSPSSALVLSYSPMQAEDLVVLEFNNTRITLILKDNPNPNNPYEIPYSDIDPTVIANHLNLVRAISQYYIVEQEVSGFRMTAREIDSRWDVTLNNTLSTGDWSAGTTPANLSAAKRSFKGYVEVFLQDDYTATPDQSKPIGLLDADPHREVIDETLTASEDLLDWEVQELIEPYIDIKLPLLSGVPVVTGVLINYWIKLYESYGTPPVPGLMTSVGAANNYYQTIRAAVPHHEWQPTTIHDEYLKGATAANRKWLTNAPQGKRVGVNSHEWLSCYYTSTNNIVLQVTVTYYDNSTSIYFTPHVLDGSDVPNTVACFGVGPAQIALSTHGTIADMAYYDVELYDADTSAIISAKHRYTLDHQSYLNERELVFLGQLGNWETARFIGQEVQGYENDAIEATASRTPWNTGEPRYLKAKAKRDRVIQFSSGYKRDDEVEWLNELAISEQVYIVENNSLLPMAIETDGGGSFGDVYADLHSASFTGRIASKV